MYRSTFAHLNTRFDVPTDAVQPVQTTDPSEPWARRHGSRRPRRRLALGLARLVPGASSSP